jgi:cellulose synthase (UDP-forming)
LRLFEKRLRELRRNTAQEPRQDRILLLIPAYREDPETVRLTLLSAALQSYPHLEIVLLLDDPEAEALGTFEKLAAEIKVLLAQLRPAPNQVSEEAIHHISALQEQFLSSGNFALKDFANTTLIPWISHWRSLPQDAVSRHRLEAIASRSIRVFSRKRYANLTRRPTKAMNLNAFLSLLGGRWRETEEENQLILVAAQPEQSALWDLPEHDLVSVLDADTLLRFDYMDETLEAFYEPGGERVGIAFVMARANLTIRGRLHQAASIQTDLMASSLHYGASWFDAAYWSGNNGLLRWKALKEIARTTTEGDRQVHIYLPDLPSEDTVCSVWMLEKGWQIRGVLAPTVHTEVPDTFAKLLIQRQRWSSTGYHGVPGVLRYSSGRWLNPIAWLEFPIRLAYLLSIGPVSCVILLALLTLMPMDLGAQNAYACCFLYYLSILMDLRRIGQPWQGVWQVAALNIALLPVAALSLVSIASDLLTGRKLAFHRTPRSGEASSLSPSYRFVASLMVAAILGRTFFLGFKDPAGTFFAVFHLALLATGWQLVREQLWTPAEQAASNSPAK